MPEDLPITITEGPPPEERLCAASELTERGRAFVWDVMVWGRPARAFALRFDGKPVAYLNRCVHVPTEMDWQEGEFLDTDKRWIMCSIHGATYEPADGRCVGGPCGRGKLTTVRVAERGGEVYWYPSRDIRPVPFDEVPAPPAQPAAPPSLAEPPAFVALAPMPPPRAVADASALPEAPAAPPMAAPPSLSPSPLSSPSDDERARP